MSDHTFVCPGCGRTYVCDGDEQDPPCCNRESLRAEIERLRKALTEIEAIDLQWADGLDTNVERIKSLARAALSDKRTGGDDA